MQRLRGLPASAKAYFTRLSAVYGFKFVLFLGISQMLLKGIAYYTTNSSMMPLFKGELGIDASQLQFFFMIVMVPWSIKPILGLLSDLTIIGGYRRRFWLLFSAGVGMLGSGFALLAYSGKSAIGITICFAGVQFQIALFDLMSEAVFSSIMRDHPETGSDVVTLVQGYQHVGAIIAMLFVGALADHKQFYALIGILCGLTVVPIVPAVLGWLPEKVYYTGESSLIPVGGADGDETDQESSSPVGGADGRTRVLFSINTPQIRRDLGMVILILLTGFAAPLTAVITNTVDPVIGFAVAVVMTMGVVAASYFVFPILIAHIAAYQVLTSLSRPALGSAMDYFYTADNVCLPGGPQFSYAYYLTTAGLVGAVASFFAVILYQWVLSGLRFRTVLILTTILSGLVGASDLLIVTRANIAMGIPDKWAYIVGEAVMEPVLNMLNYIPSSALISKVMPVGMESSCYAFLAGINNFSSMISELSGALIFDAAGIKTVVPCNFDALWWLILVCHTAGPIAVGVPAAFLIPNMKQTESAT